MASSAPRGGFSNQALLSTWTLENPERFLALLQVISRHTVPLASRIASSADDSLVGSRDRCGARRATGRGCFVTVALGTTRDRTRGKEEMGSTSRPGESRADAMDRPVSELVKQLSEQTSTLVRKELELARAEMTQKGKAAGVGAGMFGAAALVGLLAVGVLTACLILALAEAMDAWLAALIVAAGYGALAGVLALTGKSRVQEATPPLPEQTKESVRQDVEQVKERAKAARS